MREVESMQCIAKRLSKLALLLSLLLFGAAVGAQGTPSGTIQFSSTKNGVGIGVQWGGGTLRPSDSTRSTSESSIDTGGARATSTRRHHFARS